MHSPDTSQRFIFENADVRGEIVRLHKSFAVAVQGKHPFDTELCLLRAKAQKKYPQ